MRKIILMLPLILLLTGCNSDKVICTLKTPSTVNEFSMVATYTINRNGDYVKSISTIEKYTSDKTDDLNSLAELAKKRYAEYNKKYGGYIYQSSIKGNTLESKVIIDYTKLNFKQYMEDNPSVASYAKDNKLTVAGAIKLYEDMGATCN